MSWDWLLELELEDARRRGASLRRGPVADWLRDLRLLGMRPTVMLVGNDSVPEARLMAFADPRLRRARSR